MSQLNELDRLRTNHTLDDFKEVFVQLLYVKRKNTLRYLNNRTLTFPTLYFLIPEIESNDLEDELSMQNQVAVEICRTIQGNCDEENFVHLSSDKKLHQILRWMFETGIVEDGFDDGYDMVMDGVVALLITNYQDSSILAQVAELIFQRGKKGTHFHDLVWSYFQSYDLSAFTYLANYLKSNDSHCVELACKLLNYTPPENSINGIQNHQEIYNTWLKANEKFLYFTGDSLQLTSNPIPCKVNLEAKYLQKKVSLKDGNLLKPLNQSEKNYLDAYRKATKENRRLLSKYSHEIRRENNHLWRQWIATDLEQQIQKAKEGLEGER